MAEGYKCGPGFIDESPGFRHHAASLKLLRLLELLLP